MPFLSVILTGLLAGSLGMGTFGVRSAVGQLDDVTALRVRHHLIRSLRVVMPILMLLTVGATIGAAVVGAGSARSWQMAGAGSALAVLAVSLSVHSPLNRVFLRWRPMAIPANAAALIGRWNRWDSVRVGLALLAFAATAEGALVR